MREAEYCDRVAILDGGHILAQGTPGEVRAHGRAEPGCTPTMEDAFIAIVEQARGDQRTETETKPADATSDSMSVPAERAQAPILASARRVWSLVRKEAKQIVRDPSSIAIGIILPLILILLFGYGVSLDVMRVPIAVVVEEASPEALEVAAGFQLSPYFDAQIMTSMPEAQELMLARKVDGIVRLRPDFARHVNAGDADVQILVHGVDANYARIVQGYAQGTVNQYLARRAAEGKDVVSGPVGVRDRLWFNEANESHYFLVPGLVVLVMTLIGAMLTTLVMAREWERGTFEALFVTPVRAEEILLGKTIPYFVLGMIGLALCLLAARFLFHVPFAARSWCWPARRCCTCWSRSASAWRFRRR
jgi:ABC-2 type transport system permease protein